jgi:HAE1 family hydrophobic/amphiphilic exporter-1
VDTLRAKACGLSPEEVKEELLLMQEDQLVSFLNLGEREYEVYVKELAGRLENLTQWENLWVGEGTLHLLGDIATIEEVPSPPMGIRRYNRQETEFITASIRGRNKGAITREVSERVESIPHPGVEVEIGGMEEMIQENFRWMFIAIITAIPLLYFTLVGIFRSFSNSGLVMLSLPFALIGAFLALLITQKPMGVIGLGGILMLEGIVLSNAIVFLVFVEQLRQSGKSVYDSLIEGGKIRLRPILMTSLTTMLALFPLALAGTYGGIVVTDLAIVVIGGLFTSTVLTLIILPVIYSLIHHT